MPTNDLIKSLRTDLNSNPADLLSISGDAYENEKKVIEAGRKRQDELFNPILDDILNRYQNKTDYDKAFDASSQLVKTNAERTNTDIDRRNQRFGIRQTRAEFDQQQTNLDYQTGLSQAQTATDTAQALRNRENEILSGNTGGV